MNDVEAEALLLALSAPLSWNVGPDPLEPELRAMCPQGVYSVTCEKGYYVCRCSPTIRRYRDSRMWWHVTPDLALAQRACVWHVANGRWPVYWDEGWEHLKE